MDLKPYGAFIEFTIRPLLKEVKELKFMDEIDLKKALKLIAIIHVSSVVIEALKTIICTAIIGYVAWTIYRS